MFKQIYSSDQFREWLDEKACKEPIILDINSNTSIFVISQRLTDRFQYLYYAYYVDKYKIDIRCSLNFLGIYDDDREKIIDAQLRLPDEYNRFVNHDKFDYRDLIYNGVIDLLIDDAKDTPADATYTIPDSLIKDAKNAYIKYGSLNKYMKEGFWKDKLPIDTIIPPLTDRTLIKFLTDKIDFSRELLLRYKTDNEEYLNKVIKESQVIVEAYNKLSSLDDYEDLQKRREIYRSIDKRKATCLKVCIDHDGSEVCFPYNRDNLLRDLLSESGNMNSINQSDFNANFNVNVSDIAYINHRYKNTIYIDNNINNKLAV